ncbi:MAG: hypothetical protein FWG98_14190 [Candidatus Cloacimonetes bacterium]|nr:hypothetical protein [Candidatus Cloacimonadota bacterium]
MKKTIIYVLIASLLLIGFLACSDKKTNPKEEDTNSNQFVGTWKISNASPFAIIFRANMTFEIQGTGAPVPVVGTYTFEGKVASLHAEMGNTTTATIQSDGRLEWGGNYFTKQ